LLAAAGIQIIVSVVSTFFVVFFFPKLFSVPWRRCALEGREWKKREREGGGKLNYKCVPQCHHHWSDECTAAQRKKQQPKKVPDVIFEKIKTMVGATENHHLQKGNPKKFRRKKRRQSSYSSVNFRFRTKFPVFIWGLFYFSDQT
jgi:hypothetical protein